MITLPSPITERALYLSKQIDASSINDIVKELHKIIASDSDISRFCQIERGFSYIPEPIRIYINSSGGSVYSMLGLYDFIRMSPTPVHTYTYGMAASAAAVLLTAGKRRFATAHSFVLIHSVSSWLTGKVEDLKDDLKQTECLNDLINKLLAEHTKISVSRLADKDKYKEDWWISAPEALELGIIDEIIG